MTTGAELLEAVYDDRPLNGPFDYAGLAEVAEYLGVTKQCVANWRTRGKSFPEPVAELRMGPIWRLCHIRDFKRINANEPDE